MSAHKLDVLNDLPQNDNKLKLIKFLFEFCKIIQSFVEKWITIMWFQIIQF